MRSLIAASLLSVFALNAFAELPSQSDLDATMRRQSASVGDMLDRAQREMTPRERPKAEPMKEIVPSRSATSKDDLPDLLRQMSKQKPGAASATDSLLVFISFSMPPRVIEELSRQAKESGAVLVLRGMKDSNMRSTKEAAVRLNKGRSEWMIHPELFKQFRIDRVPAVVVAAAGADQVDSEGCAPDVEYASVMGDVSIEFALNVIRAKAKREIAELATDKLRKMGRGGL